MELMGFKSFADRTHIDFSPGISALLGPNGCGKSNIVDAVKWVLGEQSTKNMRAMKMEDVIFNGTQKRKALNVAEVTLTISNETSILDIDAPEIEVKRRLFRNGESEYYINNAQVRLKELRELFFDTGIGKTAYSILEQGKIDQILSSRPEERRYLFEEAAGITKFKLKGQEAERKLEKTRENIKQIQNILTEVSKNYFNLKEQADKTTEYRTLKENLFQVEVSLQILKIENLKTLHEKRGEEHLKSEKKLQEIEASIHNITKELSDSHLNQGKLRQEHSELEKKLFEINIDREKSKNRLQSIKERDKEYQAQIKQLEEKESKYSTRSNELKSEIKEKKEIIQDLTKHLADYDKLIAKCVNESLKFQENIDKNIKESETLASETGINEERKESVINELKELSTLIADKLESSLQNFSLEKHETLIELFKKQLQLAKSNPSILYNLTTEFEEVVNSFPKSIFNLLEKGSNLNRKKELDKEILELNEKIQSKRKKLSTLSSDTEILRNKIDVNNQVISKNKISSAEMKVKISGIEDSITIINKNLIDEENLLSELKREKIQLNEKIKQLSLDKTNLEKNEELIKKEDITKQKMTDLEKSIQAIRNLNSTKESELLKKRETLSSLSLQVERFNIEAEHLDSKLKEIYSEFQEKYSVELEEVSKNLDKINGDEDFLKEKLHEIRARQKLLGQINLMAPEEFEEVSKRYNFLKTQIDDLKEADRNLTNITEQIEKESSKMFRETFESIKESFSLMYQRLFGGGSAELKLTDPKNILECGIEIYARPPGKSLENISLLSGGERSLTAVALLFATYSIKPSPFCILDEIDAALDERNISRFVSTLTEFSKESQFIVITHNKKTVTGSEALLGVTMQESGVSKLITMRLEHEEKEE